MEAARGELCPLDGRYRDYVAPIRNVFSERALVAFRVEVELAYFADLAATFGYQTEVGTTNESLTDRIFLMEKTTRHDVKAVEIVLREEFEKDENLRPLISLIHFGLTSQDVNSVAVWLQVRAARDVVAQGFSKIAHRLANLAAPHCALTMLSRTHGQPATPTTLGKEMLVFEERLLYMTREVERVVARTKFGGATGGFNAHWLAHPSIDWPRWADDFLMRRFRMERQQHTTQIDHYDGMAQLFDAVKRCNTVLIDFCRDMWQYISMEYFRQTKAAGAVGSSTMPHKTNPIHFENAEGNFMLANALFEFMASKLPVSRLQRDLTDSTVTRNIGMAFGYTQLAICKVLEGLDSITADAERVSADLAAHWEVVTEGIQTVLRAAGVANAYEMVKARFDTTAISQDSIALFAAKLQNDGLISEQTAQKIANLTPNNYAPYRISE